MTNTRGLLAPNNHLKMYCQKMGDVLEGWETLDAFFQESMVGEVIIWYTNLESFRICSWKDLMVAFIRQY